MTGIEDMDDDEFARLVEGSSLGDEHAARRMADADPEEAQRAARRARDGLPERPRGAGSATTAGANGRTEGLANDRPAAGGPARHAAATEGHAVAKLFLDHPEYAEDLFAGTVEEPLRYRLGGAPWARGAQGVVYRAVEVGPGNYPYAVKALNVRGRDIQAALDRWREKLRAFRTLLANPNFAVPLEVFVGPAPARPGAHDHDDLRIYLVMPWVEGDDLADHLAEHRGERHLVGTLEMLLPVAETLDWLQGQRANLTGERFVHGDVKPGNVIATRDRGGVLVDPDLWGREEWDVADRWGTPPYAAPEVFADGRYSGAADRFALGKVVCEVLLGHRPANEPDGLTVRDELRRIGVVRERPELLDHVVGMLAEQPGNRPAQATPWLTTLIGTLKDSGLPDREEVATSRRRRRVALLALSLLVVVALVAGGVYAADQAGRCDAVAEDAVGRGDGVLKIGSLIPRSGRLAAQGPQVAAGAEMAVADIAAAGGIPGLQVVGPTPGQEQDEADGGDAACEAVGTLLGDGVDAIIGPSASQTALGVLGRVTDAGAMLVSPANTSPDLSAPGLGRYFRTAPSDVLQGRILGALVAAEGNRSVAVVARDDAYGRGLEAQVAQELRGQGVATVTTEVYAPEDTDHGDVVDRLRGQGVDGVVLIGFDETSQLLRQMIAAGLGPDRINVYGTEGFLRETLPAQVTPGDPGALAGLRGTTLLPLDPGFASRLRDFRPGLADLSYAAQAYDATVVTALAAASAGTDDPRALTGRMVDVTRGGTKCDSFAACIALLRDDRTADIDYDGASGVLEFTGGGEPCIATYSVVRFDESGTLSVYRTGTGANLCTSLTRDG